MPETLPSWMTDPEVLRLARHIYDTEDLSLLPILGDALEEAGCSHRDWVPHCHAPAHTMAKNWCTVVDHIMEGRL